MCLCCFPGCSAFVIDLWGKKSDPFLQASLFFGTIGCTLSVQVAKQFLAERDPLTSDNFLSNITVNGSTKTNHTSETIYTFSTATPGGFQSHIDKAYFIIGALCVVGTVVQLVSWVHSACKLHHWLQHTKGKMQSSSPGRPSFHGSNKLFLLLGTLLLCLVAFLGFAIEEQFAAIGITFAVNTLHWTKNDASNLVTLLWASIVTSSCISIVCAKFVEVNKLMIVSSLICCGGSIFMTSMIKVTPFSLWIGASLLGLGVGNAVANAINAGKRLTSQTGIISSFIFGSAYTGKIVAPLLVGYLLDNVDAMWFLYLGVVYSSSLLVLSVVFQVMLLCNRKYESVRQEGDAPVENKTSEV